MGMNRHQGAGGNGRHGRAIRRNGCGALLAALALGMMGCGEADLPGNGADAAQAEDTDRLTVYVVNYPLQYFAERVGGERVEVTFPAPAEVDPAEWMPDSQTVRAYQGANVILLHGADYADWPDRVSLPTEATVNTAAAFGDRLLEVEDAYVHAHGPDGARHAHAGIASMTWLDPTLAIEHARAVKRALAERRPSHADAFAQRFDALAKELRELDTQLEQIVGAQGDRPLLASEPAYHYLEARYSLDLESLHWGPGAMPDEAQWAALDEKLEHHPASAMLWPRAPMPEVASRLAEHGIDVIVYAPSDQPPDSGDLLSVMRANVANLRAALDSGDSGDG